MNQSNASMRFQYLGDAAQLRLLIYAIRLLLRSSICADANRANLADGSSIFLVGENKMVLKRYWYIFNTILKNSF